MNTITPGFFVRYFEHLEELIGEGTVLTPKVITRPPYDDLQQSL